MCSRDKVNLRPLGTSYMILGVLNFENLVPFGAFQNFFQGEAFCHFLVILKPVFSHCHIKYSRLNTLLIVCLSFFSLNPRGYAPRYSYGYETRSIRSRRRCFFALRKTFYFCSLRDTATTKEPEIFRIADDLYSDKRAIQLTQSWLDSALTSSVDRREVFKLITTGFRSQWFVKEISCLITSLHSTG